MGQSCLRGRTGPPEIDEAGLGGSEWSSSICLSVSGKRPPKSEVLISPSSGWCAYSLVRQRQPGGKALNNLIRLPVVFEYSAARETGQF